MPRSTLPNRHSNQFDLQLQLRDQAAIAANASTAETAIAFPATKNLEYKAVVNVTGYTGYVATTAQWAVAVEFSADNVTFYQVGNSLVLTGVLSQLEIALSGAAVEAVIPNAAYVRVKATKTGTPGDLSYGAFLAPDSD